jgi:hypothetical protein
MKSSLNLNEISSSSRGNEAEEEVEIRFHARRPGDLPKVFILALGINLTGW